MAWPPGLFKAGLSLCSPFVFYSPEHNSIISKFTNIFNLFSDLTIPVFRLDFWNVNINLNCQISVYTMLCLKSTKSCEYLKTNPAIRNHWIHISIIILSTLFWGSEFTLLDSGLDGQVKCQAGHLGSDLEHADYKEECWLCSNGSTEGLQLEGRPSILPHRARSHLGSWWTMGSVPSLPPPPPRQHTHITFKCFLQNQKDSYSKQAWLK